MIVRNWIDCPTKISNGYIIERVIFTKRDRENPSKEGAILKHIESFSRAYIEPLCVTQANINKNIQEVFYIVNGKGTFIANDIIKSIGEGDGILIPPEVKYSIENEIDTPLEMLILRESVPEGTEVKKEPIFKNYRESPIGQGHWNHLVHALFGKSDGLINIHSVLIVGIEPMQTADTHGHNEGTDEIWYMIKGSGLHVVNQEVRRQRPGDAIPVAPSSGHSLINDTNEPLQTFYFAHYE